MLRSSLNRSLESSLAAGTPRFSAIPSAPGDLIRALRLCSDRGHPGGQESGESVASATSLTGWGAPNGGGLQQYRKLGTIPAQRRPTFRPALGDELEVARAATTYPAKAV